LSLLRVVQRRRHANPARLPSSLDLLHGCAIAADLAG
jgi:hypothetical protein